MDDDLEAIRDGIRRVCEAFPDRYWRECDEAHEFPWDFYAAMAEGGFHGIATEWWHFDHGDREAVRQTLERVL